jgi:O-antigen ligase
MATDASGAAQTTGSLAAILRDRQRWAWCGDWLAVAVAATLPWSTTSSLVLISLWYLCRFGMGDYGAVRHEAFSAAGGLPLALCALGALGVLWAEASWTDRFDGLASFYKFLAVPLLLAQFRRSERTTWVLAAFVASCAILLVASWALASLPDLAWRGRDRDMPGIPVRDYISQGQVFTLCVFGLLEAAVLAWRTARRPLACGLLLLALAFLSNILYVAPSRTALVAIPLLLVLFGLHRFGWRIVAPVLILATLPAAVVWQTSPMLRHRTTSYLEEIRDYKPSSDAVTSAGERLEYWRKSISFIAEAPLLGHGTGSIREQFRRSAVDQTGLAARVAANPHNQVFAVAIQLGLVGTAVLIAMWAAHVLLFRGTSIWAGIGLILVVQNIVSSLFNSHLFDFTHGWIYVWGVGVLGGATLRMRDGTPERR